MLTLNYTNALFLKHIEYLLFLNYERHQPPSGKCFLYHPWVTVQGVFRVIAGLMLGR